ncbi:MAG TPA: hypothetical protein ENJ35_09990 [Gammaproteobacteria bacterium]|nr:hypothetical protein [Gammaproteobacteria bacterium]
MMIFVALIGTVLVTVVFESALRLVTHEPKGPVKYRSHPTALVTLKPNLVRKHTAWGEMHYYRTNDEGVRDDSALCRKPDVLLFGDSNLFARFLPFDETLGEQLEHSFDDTFCSVNFGVPGYGPDQSLLRMLYEVDRLELMPQVVVFHVFSDNDYGDLFRNYLFTVNAAGELQPTSRDRTDFKLRIVERLQAQYLLVRKLRDLAMELGMYRLPADEYLAPPIDRPERALGSDEEVLHYIDSVEQVGRREFENYQQGKYTTWLDDIDDFYLALNPDSEAAHQARQLLAGIFRTAKRKSDELNACFVVLIQPAESDVADTGPVSRADLALYSEVYKRSYHPENLTDIAVAAAESAGVDYIDLFNRYEQSEVPVYESIELDKGDNHWNAAGVRVAAEALRSYIIENACLDKGRVPAH